MNNVKYVGMNVHKSITVIVVLNELGQFESRSQIKTKGENICDFLHGASLRNSPHKQADVRQWGHEMKKAVFAIACLASIGVSFAATEVLTVSPDGVGSIRANTPFNQKKVAALLNEFKVVSAKGMTEGEEYPILKVFDQKGELAVINPSEDRKKIFSIVVVSNRVKNVLGPKIGDSYGKIYGTSVHKSCSAGTEEMSGRVICQDPKSDRVQYVFKGVYDGPDGEAPAFEILKNWKMAQIVWKP